MAEENIGFNETVTDGDAFGFEGTAKLVLAYSDIENNRKMIAENWPNSPLDPSTRIMRFTTLDRLRSLLQTRMNYLAPVLKWKDVYEGLSRNITLSDQNNRLVDWSSISVSFFGQCWTTTRFDSELLWNARCPDLDKVGVCIRSTFGKLVKNFVMHFGLEALNTGNFARCGLVAYQDNGEVETRMQQLRNAISASAGMVLRDSDLLDCLMIKRKSFQDENEVRLILDRHALEGPPPRFVRSRCFSTHVTGISYQVDPSGFIDEILFDPRIPDNTASQFINEIKNVALQNGWTSGRAPLLVRQSELYKLESRESTMICIPDDNHHTKKGEMNP